MYKILNAEKLSANVFLMDVEAPRVAKHCLPGQFVIVKMDEVGERIPLTICDYDAEKGTVTIVFQPAGASTTRMSELKAGIQRSPEAERSGGRCEGQEDCPGRTGGSKGRTDQ